MLQQLKKTQHFWNIVQSIKDENSAWSDICVIVANKDFTEWKVLQGKIPVCKALVLSMACYESNVQENG